MRLMPQIKNHASATIEALFLPSDPKDFCSSPVNTLAFSLNPNGIVGEERHRRNATLADIRSPSYRKKVDTVLNRQSISFVGSEDLDYIADALGLDPHTLVQTERILTDTNDAQHTMRMFLAQYLGANVLLSSFQATDEIANFRSLTPGIDFGPYDAETRKFTDATVMITRINGPCIKPAQRIQNEYPGKVPDLAKRFLQVAQGRRGFVGMVAKEGIMTVGQSVWFVPFGEK
jgi:hypothetical protein